MKPILSIENVSMVFGGLCAVDNLSMSVEQGKIHSLIGPNGAGKTTVLNIISGFYEPTQGIVRFNDKEIQGLASNKISGYGIARTFQNVRLFKELTVLENVQIGMHNKIRQDIMSIIFKTPSFRNSERDSIDKAMEFLTRVGLENIAGEKVKNLPYGQQKVLEIARALAQEPKLILLDEPAAGLNDTETVELAGIIKKLINYKITILMIEHNMRFVTSLSDCITVLNFGEKIAEGKPEEVIKCDAVIQAYLGKRGSEI